MRFHEVSDLAWSLIRICARPRATHADLCLCDQRRSEARSRRGLGVSQLCQSARKLVAKEPQTTGARRVALPRFRGGKKALQKLETADEIHNFMAAFWKKRDPSPGAVRNEASLAPSPKKIFQHAAAARSAPPPLSPKRRADSN